MQGDDQGGLSQSTLWHHNHALGITRLNVMMGLAGFHLIRDAAEAALNLPAGGYEVPLVIQDRTLKADGSIDYPSTWKGMCFGDKAARHRLAGRARGSGVYAYRLSVDGSRRISRKMVLQR